VYLTALATVSAARFVALPYEARVTPLEFAGAVPLPNEPVVVMWDVLEGLDYRTGAVSKQLTALEGKRVKIPGFMVPLEDFAEVVTEFLLVPYFGACVHTPPPPPNQMVYVKMDGGAKTKIGWWDPVWIEGTLAVKNYDGPYGVAGFQLTGMRVTPYERPPRQ
jgi:hypothetical protein